jgi:photosystem II stability/assembly factor-like uncharacterized protein
MGLRRVIEILDEAIGGPQVGIGAHRTFWRGLTRDEFVAKKVFGKALVIVGDGANSNLVLALKGQSPFGADLPDPPAGATISRMPAGRSPVPADSVAFIEQWINDGCPDEPPPAQPTWRATNAPEASSRTDDIWFLDHDRGWAVNSNGQILHTADGFSTWQEQFHDEELYLRCVGFASESRGWVGTLTANSRLLETQDGGATWTPVTGLPDLAPSAVCGLSVVNESVVYASGTNFPNRPARMMRTLDGGATWQGWEMSAHADLLVDTYFTDPDNGWVVGGKATVPNPTRDDVRAVVLRTTDGGQTWTDKAAPLAAQLPLGEWGWKIHFVTEQLGYIALESFTRAAILKTVDGGESWIRIDVNDPQGNANLEGVGFLDDEIGWVGGWGSSNFTEGFSSATVDGGNIWQDANQIGRFINRFRFFRDIPIGYASGLTIYKYSDEPLPAPPAAAPSRPGLRRVLADAAPKASGRPLQITATVPDGADQLRVSIWDRFGEHVRRLADEKQPQSGTRTLEWDGVDENGQPVQQGAIIVRVTVDGHSESQIMHLAPQ